MKATELIAALAHAVAEHGDLPVGFTVYGSTNACVAPRLVVNGLVWADYGSHVGDYLSVSDHD